MVVLGVEKKSVAKLQEDRTVRKICLIDDHVVMAFAGMFSFMTLSHYYKVCLISNEKKLGEASNMIDQNAISWLGIHAYGL